MSTTVQFALETLDGPSLDRNISSAPKLDGAAHARITLARQAVYQPDVTSHETTKQSHYPKAARLAIIAGASLAFWGAIAATLTWLNT